MKNLILLPIIIIFIGCGAMKKSTTKTKDSSKMEHTENSIVDKKSEEKNAKVEESKINSETNTKKSSETVTDNQNQTVTETETIEPIDPTKPATFIDDNGKKKELNNSKSTKTKTTSKNNSKSTAKNQEEINTKIAAEKKATELAIKKASELAKRKAQEKAESDKKTLDEQKKRDSWSLWNLLWLIIPVGLVYIGWQMYKDKIW